MIGEVRVLPRHGSDGAQWTAADKAGPSATAPTGGVRATLLRRVPIPATGQFASRVLRLLKTVVASRRLRSYVGLNDVMGSLDLKQQGGKGQPSRSRRGRKGRGEEFYARIAQTYVEEAETRKPQRPLEAIKKQHRLATINHARAAVYRAREMGYLGGRQPGKVSGFLTAKAEAVLARRGTPKRSRTRRG